MLMINLNIMIVGMLKLSSSLIQNSCLFIAFEPIVALVAFLQQDFSIVWLILNEISTER